MSQENDYKYRKTADLIHIVNERITQLQVLIDSIKKSLKRIEGTE